MSCYLVFLINDLDNLISYYFNNYPIQNKDFVWAILL
ncbi:hypothetical protein EELLY_v1c03190 [Entomoplasma ellychniae]|uniref:Uncharacterized protein n=1 Tax=Entomoplasma ellychniae TaxID=2114 RepID=A0A8E2QY87_9MOLU|nr:hypothetical protein EELLY_v1c03190 [Entomoplasma ellychniae]